MGEHKDKAKGAIKQAVGTVTGNDKLKRDGRRDEIKGNVKGVINDAKDAAKDLKKERKAAGR
jgi:uncharacterized protein YjbJ (UPF0337 family)